MCDVYEMYDMNPPVSVYCDGSLPDGADSAHLALIVLVGHSGEQIMLRGPSGIELLGLLVRNAMGAAQDQLRKLNAQRDALQQRLAGMGAYNDTLKGQLRLADVAMQDCRRTNAARIETARVLAAELAACQLALKAAMDEPKPAAPARVQQRSRNAGAQVEAKTATTATQTPPGASPAEIAHAHEQMQRAQMQLRESQVRHIFPLFLWHAHS